ncbi:Fic family protein [Candidatus Saccharibacteria bacterium]|nr:Fic family protein [Candidatus Saccharibacteria bacterium]
MLNQIKKDKLDVLCEKYRFLAVENPEAIKELTLAEIPEQVYNSNAIENSTLTLEDTEDILLRDQIRTDHEVREIYEAKNLAKATNYLLGNPREPLTIDLILTLHKLLLTDINDSVAGRFRSGHEWVRVGSHIGANPEFVFRQMAELIDDYHYHQKQADRYFLENIAYFHGQFELIHPFCDGNGRIGRLLTNRQLQRLGLPPIIIRSKTKVRDYYLHLHNFETMNSPEGLENMFYLALSEALNRRIATLTSERIIPLSDWAKANHVDEQSASNRAARQTLPAFHVRDKWMISENTKPE